MRNFRTQLPLAILALSILGAPPLAAQSNIAIDPYRAVEAQQIRPNLNVIIDHSSLMISDIRGNRYPATYTGEVTAGSWRCMRKTDPGVYGATATCLNSKPYRYTYFGPSRLAEVKNVLGMTSIADMTTFGNTFACSNSATCGSTIPTAPPVQAYQNFIYKAAINETRFNPGLVDFTVAGESAQVDVLPNPSTSASLCEANRAAYALRSAGSGPIAASTLPGCPLTSTDVVNPIAPNAGVEVATNAALNISGFAHQAVSVGTALNVSGFCPSNTALTQSIPAPALADPKTGCGRPLFNLLITGGKASACNGGTYTASATCPASTFSAPAGSPMQTADNLYQGILPGNLTGPKQRTFVLGVGSWAAPSGDLTQALDAATQEEFHQTAYFGRTDAQDPYNLGGVRLVQAYDAAGAELCVAASGLPVACDATTTVKYQLPIDPYLRRANEYVLGDTINSVVPGVSCNAVTLAGVTFRVCNGTGYVCGHRYAFLAGSRSELRLAMTLITGALSTGDFTTQIPVISEQTSVSATENKNFIYTASTSFPNFQGHLRAQDLNVCVTADGTPVLCSDSRAVGFQQVWDAGELLANRVAGETYTTSTRRIYTVDTTAAYNVAGNYWPLIKVESGASTATLSTLLAQYRPSCVNCVDAEMLKFMAGYYTSGTSTLPRPWVMGDVMGSDPMVLRRSGDYGQNTTYKHATSFATVYANRRVLILQATSAGVIHAFDAGTGKEEWAFIPPDALPAIYDQYQNFRNLQLVMGQPADTNQHIYGLNGGLNYADVDLRQPNNTGFAATYDPAVDWRTLLVGGMGKGGKAVFALDVTHSFNGSGSTAYPPQDINYGMGNGCSNNCGNAPPFQALWYKSGTLSSGTASLTSPPGETWSTPSISLDNYQITVNTTPTSYPAGRWIVSFGSGPVRSLTGAAVGNSAYTRGVHMHHLSAKDGTPVKIYQLGTAGSDAGSTLAATTIANNVAYSSYTIDFADAFKDRFYQGDTAGRLWEVNTGLPGPPAGSAPPNVDQLEASVWPASPLITPIASYPTQPIFFSPAAVFYKDVNGSSANVRLLTWSGGSFNEDGGILNNPACAGTCFVPNLYFFASDITPTPIISPANVTTSFALTSLSYRKGGAPISYTQQARTIASPSAYVPVLLDAAGSSVTDWPKARDIRVLYTVYDPGQGTCSGESSVLVFQPFGANDAAASGSGFNTGGVYASAYAADGMTSGAVVYNGQIIVNMSSRYQNAAARITGLESAFGSSGGGVSNVVLVSWREIY